MKDDRLELYKRFLLKIAENSLLFEFKDNPSFCFADAYQPCMQNTEKLEHTSLQCTCSMEYDNVQCVKSVSMIVFALG